MRNSSGRLGPLVIGRSVLPHPGPLPLGEGESSTPVRRCERERFADARPPLHPLPAGEGRGEGERPVASVGQSTLPGVRSNEACAHSGRFQWLTLFFVAILASCSPKPSNKLVVGMELAYPPFEMTDEQGRPAGISVDLARALGQHLAREVEIQNTPFDGLIPALKTAKIDLIISSMTATAERAQSIDFSEPYLRTGLCLLVGRNSPVNSAQDLDQAGRTVAVKLGTTGHTYALRQIKEAKVLVLDKEDAGVLEVVQGKADAFIYDQMSTFKNWQRNQETTRPLLKPFQEESWAIGIRKGNLELARQVNEFLGRFRAEGGFEKLGDYYLHEQKQAFKQMGYAFYF
ncbi:MAG: transporter substrate-binding domain-containing protein [Verrucomicrobia bacterium]|nr:transporter substrate-binding domain-containing protein [Verrucomicrobiota bacterium]